MELLNKIMNDIGFLDTLIDNTEFLIKDNIHLKLKIIREHLIQTHKELKQ